MIIDCAVVYASPAATVIVPALPRVKKDVDVQQERRRRSNKNYFN